MTFEGWRESFAADIAEQSRRATESEAWHRMAEEQFQTVAREASNALRDVGAPVIPVHELLWRPPSAKELRLASRNYPARSTATVMPRVLGAGYLVTLSVDKGEGYWVKQHYLLTHEARLFDGLHVDLARPERARFWHAEPFWPTGMFVAREDLAASSALDYLGLPLDDFRKAVVRALREYAR